MEKRESRTRYTAEQKVDRYIVHHKLLTRLDGASVSIALQVALEAAGDAKPRIVHDHGSEFVNLGKPLHNFVARECGRHGEFARPV